MNTFIDKIRQRASRNSKPLRHFIAGWLHLIEGAVNIFSLGYISIELLFPHYRHHLSKDVERAKAARIHLKIKKAFKEKRKNGKQ